MTIIYTILILLVINAGVLFVWWLLDKIKNWQHKRYWKNFWKKHEEILKQ